MYIETQPMSYETNKGQRIECVYTLQNGLVVSTTSPIIGLRDKSYWTINPETLNQIIGDPKFFDIQRDSITIEFQKKF